MHAGNGIAESIQPEKRSEIIYVFQFSELQETRRDDTVPWEYYLARAYGGTGHCRYALFALARNSLTPASGAAPTILATTLPFLKASCGSVASA